jgi:predicted transcriptional regulator YdeE
MAMDETIKPYSLDKGYYGVWFYLDGEQSYLAGMAVEGMEMPPEGAVVRTVPARTYAVFPCKISSIPQTYAFAYEQWLPRTEYNMDDTGCDFEYYPPGSDTMDAQAFLYLPLKKKGE